MKSTLIDLERAYVGFFRFLDSPKLRGATRGSVLFYLYRSIYIYIGVYIIMLWVPSTNNRSIMYLIGRAMDVLNRPSLHTLEPSSWINLS